MRKVILLFLIIGIIFPFPSYSQNYNFLRKLVRGVANVSLASFEIPRQMIKVTQKEGDLAGIFWGPLKGITYTLGRTLLGVYETGFFLLPPYSPLVEPEFIFEFEGEE
ncbi:MAG: hypothetical protein DRP76_03515 [Candidatus Omnitrophota bacterium]|nr:MAG: hypothetical protein DRP76_03515 [Candidatus Omnitrophota bacterium]